METNTVNTGGLYAAMRGLDNCIKNFVIFPWREGLTEWLTDNQHPANIWFGEEPCRFILAFNMLFVECYGVCEEFSIESFPYANISHQGISFEIHLRKFLDNTESVPLDQLYDIVDKTETTYFVKCFEKGSIRVKCGFCNIHIPVETYKKCSKNIINQ